MKTTKSKAAAAVRIGTGLALRKRAELLELLRPCFARTEPWLQAGNYPRAVMRELPELNGWSIARDAGDRMPDKTQRLLNHAAWDACTAMGVVHRFAAAGLEEAARRGHRRRGHLVIGAIDEPGQDHARRAAARQGAADPRRRAQVAGQEGFEFGKDTFGLDQSRPGCMPRSSATSWWSWPRWPSAPSPPRC